MTSRAINLAKFDGIVDDEDDEDTDDDGPGDAHRLLRSLLLLKDEDDNDEIEEGDDTWEVELLGEEDGDEDEVKYDVNGNDPWQTWINCIQVKMKRAKKMTESSGCTIWGREKNIHAN